MKLYGPMRMESINGKKYILVIVDDYSRFTWVKFLRSKVEAPDAIIKCIKNIQVLLNATVYNVRIDNGTEFVNQTLHECYENVGITHQTSVACTPQENSVVERRNRTLVETTLTMLIFLKAPLFFEDLDKLNAKADIGIFVGYAPAKKAFRIYNRRTRKIMETIHVTFDELTAMASEQFSSGPGLQSMTPATSCLGLVSNPVPQQLCFSPTHKKSRWGTVFPTGLKRYKEPLVEPKDDRMLIFVGCGNSSLIPLSCGSFDVIVGMDWLSKRKFVIVYHEKVVRILLEGDEILQVHGERTQGVVKNLMNTKSKEENEVHLKLVLESLRKEKLYAKVSKSNVVSNALSRKERVKLRRVRGMILAAQSEVFKQENILAKRLHGLDQQMERKGDESLYFMDRIWVLLLGSVMDEAHASRSPVLWAEIGESSLTGLELVQETTDKGVALEGRSAFGKKGKLAPRYVGPFEILERIGLVAYRLRLPEELNSVHDTFHVSNLKKCLADANLHVPLDEIKVDKKLRFVEEPVEIIDREIRKLKHRKVVLVKVRWNLKRGPEFT
ncbi:putative reverse transcriptase domain-containing protein [Tanacetum coccineum]